MLRRDSLLLLLFSLFSINVFAVYHGKNNDTSLTATDIAKIQISNNLDSLLNLWYVQNSLKINSDLPNLSIVTDTLTVPYFTDSVFRERVNRLSSPINMVYNDKVQSFIDLYTRKHRTQVEVMLGLTDYYFPMFEEILDAYNLPLELKYLPIIESALNPRAISRAGASGIWQFMYTTGKLYNLKVTSYVDERQNPVKATMAAAQYLRDLYDIYHDWTLVIAAYNCGPGNINKAILRANGKTDFWEIYNFLPRETRGYVPAFIAANYIMTYYKEHNIIPKKIEFPYKVDTIMITKRLHLQQVSDVLNIPIQQLRDLNPQYKKDIIPAINDTFSLMLPYSYVSKFINLEDSIYSYKDSVFFYNFNKKKPSMYSLQSSTKEKLYYIVKPADNLSSIADEYKVTVNEIKAWNTISKDNIKQGQKLVIYIPRDKAAKYKPTDAGQTDPKDKHMNNYSDKNSTTEDKNYIYYKVKPGDNLWTIAQKFPGTTNTGIMKLNNISDSHSLMPGQIIKIRKK